MGALIAKAVFKNGTDDISSKYNSCNQIPITLLNGTHHSQIGEILADKKLYLCVNVASK
jgi:hypothetical protein